MEEKEKMNIIDFANELSSVCKNKPKISFRVSYTATDGNTEIHKAFLQFAHDKSNNEYLAAIGKLLETADIFYYLRLLESEIMEIKLKLAFLEKQEVKQEVKEEEKKTI